MARSGFIFQLLKTTAYWQSEENNFAAACTQFFHCNNYVGEAFLNCLPNFGHKLFFRNVTGWRGRGEKRNPNLLNHARELSVRIGARLDHSGAAFAIYGAEVRRKTGRDERVGTIRNRNAFEQIVEGEVLLFQKSDVFFQRHGEVFAHALRRRLIVKSLYYFFAALERRRGRWCEKQTRHDATDDCAMESIVVGQISQNGIAAHSAPSELERPLAKSFLQ